MLGVPGVMAGVLLISGVVGGGAYGDDPLLGVVYGVLTAITYALFILILREGNADIRRPAGPLFDATAVATVVAIAAGLVVGDADLVPSWPAHAWLLTLALTSQVLGWLLITVSLPRLPAALIQGQRDFFGAHTYHRIDKDGAFHIMWAADRNEVPA